jgi:hypothetical protein
MELVKGRGINCENEVYFDYVDGEVVMTIYRDMPGVRMDRRDPNVIKVFSVDQWGEINKYLMETLDDVEGVYSDDDEGEGEDEEEVTVPIVPSLTQQGLAPVPLTANIAAKDVELPKVNSIPSMTKDEIQEKFDPITGTQNEEEMEKNGETD